MRFLNDPVIVAATNAGTVVSDAVDASYLTTVSLQATFTDNTAAGTLKLQVSNDVPGVTPSVWNDLVTASVAAGATTFLPATNICAEWVRAAFVRSAGAGTLSARLKTIGF